MHHSEGFLETYTHSRDSIIQMSLIFYISVFPNAPYISGQRFPLLPLEVVNFKFVKAVVNTVGGLLASRRVFSWLPLFFFCSYSTDSD